MVTLTRRLRASAALAKAMKRRRLPTILQSEAAECGLACLAMVMAYHGYQTDLTTLRRTQAISLKGSTLKEIMGIASAHDLACRPVRAELDDLRRLKTPAILHWDMNHFVVLKSATMNGITIVDPGSGQLRLSIEEASKHFTGVALELTPSPSFASGSSRAGLKLSDLWRRSVGLEPSLVQLFVLSAVIQAFNLLSPLYVQFAIDEVAPSADQDLLLGLALGFGAVLVLSAVTELLRDFINNHVSSSLTYQITVNVFHHLLRLPVVFFERRHVGDIVSRFSSINFVSSLISSRLILLFMDGLMAVGFYVIIFLYSTQMALFVVASHVLYGMMRLAFHEPLRRRNEDEIRAAATENSIFMETVRASQTIKLLSAEAGREQVWLNSMAAKVNTLVRTRVMQILRTFAGRLIIGLQNVLVVYAGVLLILDNSVSIGMFFSFLLYKTMLDLRFVDMFEQISSLQMIGLHLARLSDITGTATEHDAQPSHLTGAGLAHRIRGAISVKGVSFRYSQWDDLVLDDVSLEIAEREFVAITGRSGCGKTTLLKVMTGLIPPTIGQVMIDGIPQNRLAVRGFRDQIATVMQDDMLLSGSLAENVCFFDPNFDMDWIQECCAVAAIHEDILRMPMGYMSLVGDMGSMLSGGQKQRLLLARALYRRPKVLFLDEGSAHLDIETEQEINARLKEMKMTRIVVAHRLETILAADRVIDLTGGSAGPWRYQAAATSG